MTKLRKQLESLEVEWNAIRGEAKEAEAASFDPSNTIELRSANWDKLKSLKQEKRKLEFDIDQINWMLA